MNISSGWQRKFIVLFKSERTLNAKAVVSSFTHKSIDEMKANIITDSACNPIALSNKPRIKDLEKHLENLKHQFIGQSELCFYHATLVVLLRRGYKSEEVFVEFENLWARETDYLLNNLSLRWIVSACDTFIDHSTDRIRAAILMNVITLVNTLKVYETQQYLQRQNPETPHSLVPERVDSLYSAHLPLFEGLAYFRIGADDTLKNMRNRYNQFSETDKLATTILLFFFDQLQTTNSGFSTMKNLHKDEKSKWWSN